MRVLYLTMNPNRASTTTPTEGWFRELRSRGLEPVLASTQAGAFHEWALAQGIEAIQVPMPVPDEFSLRTLAPALWKLFWIVRRHRIQLIHSNEQNLWPVAQYLGRLCGIPAVVSVHFTMEPGFSEWAFRGSRSPARIFFVSEGNLEACRPGLRGVIPESNWRVLANGLDLNHYAPDANWRESFRREHGLGDGPVIGVACALRPRKQVEHLFRAAANLSLPHLRVVIAGAAVSGDEDYAASLMAEGRALLGDRLVLLGHLTELRGFYNSLDVFVNTSQEEACSISVLESLAHACPVLGYASKSVDGQILPDGGEIIEQDNIGALSSALIRWLSDPVELNRRREGALTTARSRYDIRKLSQQLWSEYHAVTGQSAG